MENNRIVIALLIIIIALLVVLGIVLMNSIDGKTATAITVTSDNTLHDGDSFSISLTDINGMPIKNQKVNIFIIDENGTEKPEHLTTDKLGNGALKISGLTVGKYTININYGGDDNYSACSATQHIEIKQVEKESSSSHSRFADAQWSRRYYWDDGTPTKGEVYLIVTPDGDMWTYDNGEYLHQPN